MAAALPSEVRAAYRTAGQTGDARVRGEWLLARRCWRCCIDDVGLDSWAVASGGPDRLVCADCVRAVLGDGLPFERVVAAHRGRAGSPRRALGEVYQSLVVFKERREGWAGLAPWLAHALAASVREVYVAGRSEARGWSGGGRWVVAPVPSYRGRRPHVRILTALAAMELPMAIEVRLDLLVKQVDMVQKGLTRAERRRESAGAYVVPSGARGVRGARVIVTDDFFTTGATATECARVLRAAGAAAVYGATVVRVVLAPGERVVPFAIGSKDGMRQVRVQLRELDGRGRVPVESGVGVLWVRFACSAVCVVMLMAGPFPIPSFDHLGVHRWVCQCGAGHVVRVRREWLGGSQQCLAVLVGARRSAELLVGVVQGGVVCV